MVRISALVVAVVVVVVFIGGTSFAQSSDEELTGTTQVFDHFLVNGGAITWFVLVPLSVATVALTIEYCLSIRRKTFVPPETLSEIEAQLAERQYVRSLQYTAEDPSVLAYVVNTGLTAAANGRIQLDTSVNK